MGSVSFCTSKEEFVCSAAVPGTGIQAKGDLEIRDASGSVTVNGRPVSLTPTEYGILRLLAGHPGQVFSPTEIYRRIWNDEPYGAEPTIAVHIRHLREKIETDPGHPEYIKAVWGQGYRMETK